MTIRGNSRKLTLVKTYVCIFICFSTRAVYLELCSDLSAETFLAAFHFFTDRWGLPAHA